MWLNCHLVVQKAELVSDELGYLAEEIFKEGVEGVTCILIANSKNMREQGKLRNKKLSKQTKIAFDNLENSQHTQITEGTKIKFTVKKVCSGGKSMFVPRQVFIQEIRFMTH